MQETWVQSLGPEDPLAEDLATHSSILAWKIPWTEEPGGLQSVGSQGVRHDWTMKQARTQSSYEASSRALSSRDALEMPSQVISRFPKCMSQDKEPGTKVKRDSTSQCNCKILLSSRGTRVETGPISWGRRGAAVARLWKGLYHCKYHTTVVFLIESTSLL